MSQYQSAGLVLLEARAQAAADAGLEYAAFRALVPSGIGNRCFAVGPSIAPGAPDLSGYVVTLKCVALPGSGSNTIKPQGNPPAKKYYVYRLSATATHGVYGQVDYVSRTTVRTLTDAPP